MKRYCIIGAGACGLAVVKTFAEQGIAFDCFEAEGDLGGIWNPDSPHAVYGSTHRNSSEELSGGPDKRLALTIFIGPRCFADETQLGVERADAEDRLCARRGETRTARAAGDTLGKNF